MKDIMQTTTIKIDVEGTSVFCHVTRRTTCYDVIKMVVNQKQTNSRYGLYESRDGIEKMIAPQTRLLKLIRSWGAEQGLYSLVLRQDRNDKLKSKMAAISKAKRQLNRIRSSFMKDAGEKSQHCHGDNINFRCGFEKKYDKDICLDDNTCSVLLPARTLGDGADDNSIELPVRDRGDDEEYSGVVLDLTSDLDRGFLSDDSCASEVDCLNECFVDCSDVSVADDRDLTDLERNIIDDDVTSRSVMAYFKNILSKGGMTAHDDALDSFMNTFVSARVSNDELFSMRIGTE